MPFEPGRLKFSVQVSFAMSINKTPGQSVTLIGLHLLQLCFLTVSSALEIRRIFKTILSARRQKLLCMLLQCSNYAQQFFESRVTSSGYLLYSLYIVIKSQRLYLQEGAKMST